MDAYSLTNNRLQSGQALAQRLRTHLLEIKQKHPMLQINPKLLWHAQPKERGCDSGVGGWH